MAGVKIGARAGCRPSSPAGSGDAADLAGGAVVGEPRPGEVAAGDALDGVHRQRLADHRPAGDLRRARRVGEHVVRHEVGQPLEPPQRHPGEDRALVGDRRRSTKSYAEIRSLATMSSVPVRRAGRGPGPCRSARASAPASSQERHARSLRGPARSSRRLRGGHPGPRDESGMTIGRMFRFSRSNGLDSLTQQRKRLKVHDSGDWEHYVVIRSPVRVAATQDWAEGGGTG